MPCMGKCGLLVKASSLVDARTKLIIRQANNVFELRKERIV